MGYLGVKNELTNDVELADKSRGVFTEIVENFHDFSWFKNFFEAVLTRVNFL